MDEQEFIKLPGWNGVFEKRMIGGAPAIFEIRDGRRIWISKPAGRAQHVQYRSAQENTEALLKARLKRRKEATTNG